MKTTLQTAEHYQWGPQCDGWHLLKSGDLSVIREKMPPGATEQMHYHRFSQQLFYILSGEATFMLNGERHEVSARESLHIPPGVLHNISNNGNVELDFLLVSQPPAQGDRIEIIAYTEELQTHIRDLNVEWLEKYFKVEENDRIQLADPKREIMDKGGFIYYARYKNEIVGTASLLKISDDCFELGKMAVTERMQGHGIGNKLLEYCVQEAIQKKASKLILYSNRSLAPALHIYRKYGFYEVSLEHGHYERADIKMEKLLVRKAIV